MRTLVLAVPLMVSMLCGCGTPVGQCTAAVDTQLTAADGGTVTCQCKGPCGCFYADGGRCPQ
ncbi:MAG: hypothetical protein U0228_31170 [Myxococcaceae bacterium]